MLELYCKLIRKYMDELQHIGWFESYKLELAETEYTYKMNRLYGRLNREYGFDKQTFYASQDQAMML